MGTETCQLCKKGFIWDNYNCICNLSNCEQCGENGCLVCKIGYYYNKDTNECEKRSGFKEIYCDEFECDICFSELSGACIKCKQGTKLRRGHCEVLRHVSDYGTCFSSDYYKEGEYCYPNCDGFECPIKYNHSTNLCPFNKCLVCQNNRLNILDECDNYNECSLIEGCLNCISDEECLYCKQGYYLLGGKCKKCIKGCSICYNDYSCEYCLSGFELTSDKQCNLSNNFDFDIVEYNKYKNEFLNKSCSDDKCLHCTFKNGEEKCIKCISGYGAYMDQCKKCSSNCSDCRFSNGSNEFCTECINGYYVNDVGKCSLICSDKNCIECYLNSEGKEYCKECKLFYALKNEICTSCHDMEGCDYCYFENETEYCTKCYVSGYFLKDGICFKCSNEKCEICYFEDVKEHCTYCKYSGYMPYEDK